MKQKQVLLRKASDSTQNPFSTSVNTCKCGVRQSRKCDVANLSPKRSEKPSRYYDVFSTLYRRRCVCWV